MKLVFEHQNKNKKAKYLKIAIVDYNMGNLASVKNAFLKCEQEADVIKNKDDIFKYDHVILPGVGAFGDAMDSLKESGFDESIKEYANNGGKLLGICLGAQLLFDKGDEFGLHSGLGLIPGTVKIFDKNRFKIRLKVPHMGWNKVRLKEDRVFDGIDDNVYLYFVHSHHIECEDKYIIGTTEYGYEFASIVKNNNIYGIQPHPEKSHDNGIKMIQNFINL
ncbi:MAG: Imidazole glycerol phosphate synthase amidotransferase subunit (EC [uncultured Campylobacterales bacterium]|uniref:Imidazole glycerol phosphate synthase subunit HisH n=1 Tax=uncultured Campylobacterales bacterium TaxID=352960 RepID=A0A6S6SMY4_9BACT|nr:MAG: Imidazole glycerol phosphate synthase amidotransferase subunit (EC [uncultured Campylobacterales bacterium]